MAGPVVAHADTNGLPVESETFTNQFEAYARVEPVAVISVQPVGAGVVNDLHLLPGALVKAGQKLGELTGPEIEAMQARAKSDVAAAEAKLAAAKKSLQTTQEQLASHLTTQQQVADAESVAADASGQLDIAQARLKTVQMTATVTAPSDGTVLSVNAANGQRVTSGQTILALQASGGLWLKATYYGSDITAIHPGIIGRFVPASGNSIPVKVASVFGSVEPDGGESVGLVATVPNPDWLNGQFGTVTLDGEARARVVVPTQALILDKGKWWVLVQTPQGNQPRDVVPGVARGRQTFIESGLKPGERIVVENAYLEFHRDISQTYQAPD